MSYTVLLGVATAGCDLGPRTQQEGDAPLNWITFVPEALCLWVPLCLTMLAHVEGEAILWIVPPVRVPSEFPGGTRVAFGGAQQCPPSSPALGQEAESLTPLGSMTLISPMGGACLSPPWLISNPQGDFGPCQHPVPMNFLPVGPVSLEILPDPVRWLSVCSVSSLCPAVHVPVSNPVPHSVAVRSCHHFDA